MNANTPYTDIFYSEWRYGRLQGFLQLSYENPDLWSYGIDECKDEMDQLYMKFINKFIPEATLNDINSDKYCVTDYGQFTVLDLEAVYLANNPELLEAMQEKMYYPSETDISRNIAPAL